MFRCRMTFDWMVFAGPHYEYRPLDSKLLTREGAKQFDRFFKGIEGRKELVLGEAPMPTKPVTVPGGGSEECVTLAGIVGEIQRRLDLMQPEWKLKIREFPSEMQQPYKYLLYPPECVHNYVLQALDSGTPVDVTFDANGSIASAQVLATLVFWEVPE